MAFCAFRSSPASSSKNFVISGSVSGEDVEACGGCCAAGACPSLCDVAGFSGADFPQSHPIVRRVGSLVYVSLLEEAVAVYQEGDNSSNQIGRGRYCLYLQYISVVRRSTDCT